MVTVWFEFIVFDNINQLGGINSHSICAYKNAFMKYYFTSDSV